MSAGGIAELGPLTLDSENDQIKLGNIILQAVPSSGLPYTMMESGTIAIPVLLTLFSGSVQAAANNVAAVQFANTTFVIPSNFKKHLKSASLVLDHAWAATADGTIQLYDSTGSSVVVSSTAKTGGESSEWESASITLANLVEGHTLYLRANITVAGSSGEKVTLNRAFLLLQYAVS